MVVAVQSYISRLYTRQANTQNNYFTSIKKLRFITNNYDSFFFPKQNNPALCPPSPIPLPLKKSTPKHSSGKEGGCKALDLQVMYETSYHETNLVIGNNFPKVISNSA